MVKSIEEKIAFIFPGQGAQYPGMGKDLYDKFKGAKDIFDKADEILGYSLSRICFEGPADKLASTEISQPAILTASIAALEALREVGIMASADFYAGLSLGEYSALTSAGSMRFEETVALVSKRGK
ncbi:MAG: ACP S-malonyltransferase, partial [Candidatus Omnitrophica bacterium]|nr:ACP S-malonyltransferase [Candidatus Omnitrophota bacterium]